MYFGYLVLSLVILLFMVLIHELGHYTTAKILGFTVEEFAIGFGPKLFSVRRKNGERFSIRLLPLGGFCAFYGENDETPNEKAPNEKAPTENNGQSAAPSESDNVESADGSTQPSDGKVKSAKTDDDLLSYVMKAEIDEQNAKAKEQKNAENENEKKDEKEEKIVRLDKNGDPAKTFNEQKPWKRIIVLLGGVLFNFLSAFVFSLIFIWAVGYSLPQVQEKHVDASGVEYNPVFEVGDVILGVNGKDIGVMNSFSELLENVGEGEVTVKISRNGDITEVTADRTMIDAVDDDGKPYKYLGFGINTKYIEAGNNAGNAFKYCVPFTFKLSWSIIGSFGDILTGKEPITSMTGPIGSLYTMAQLSQAGWQNILLLLPLLASNLAIFNILPFPALDGAHIVFTVIEWIRKKPINRKVEGMIHGIGLIVLLLFVVVVDILSFVL